MTVKLDVAFLVDTTGSMKDDIKAVKDSLFDIVDSVINKTENLRIRFSLVSYRDHPPQDRTYVTRTIDFTDDVKRIHREIGKLRPSEGGDTPEAVADAIHDARMLLNWDPDAYKVLLLVGDAPPHGREYNLLEDDYFPDGCPKGYDPIQELQALKTDFGETIFIFVCGCNPLVEASFRKIADSVQSGKYYSLHEAHELPEAILSILEGVSDLIELDRQVLVYYEANDGTFDLAEGAAELGIQLRELKTALSRLQELGRIQRWPKGRPLTPATVGITAELGDVPDALLAGKAFHYSVTVENPSRTVVGIRIVVSLIAGDEISEITNELHEIGHGTKQVIHMKLIPMSDVSGKATVKTELFYGSKLVTSRIYTTRVYQAS